MEIKEVKMFNFFPPDYLVLFCAVLSTAAPANHEQISAVSSPIPEINNMNTSLRRDQAVPGSSRDVVVALSEHFLTDFAVC